MMLMLSFFFFFLSAEIMQNNDVIGQFEAALINVSSELVDANK